MKEKEINAIYEKDLEQLLENINLLKKVVKGKCNCIVCNDKVKLENFGGIVQEKGEIKLFCNKEKCIEKISKLCDGT